MDLLTFARGPALQAAFTIFLIGTFWRLLGVLLLRRKLDHSEPRQPALAGAFKGQIAHLWPYQPFASRVMASYLLGYAFHIGLVVVIFFYLPHILFIQDLFGVSWPALPHAVVNAVGGITLMALVALLVKRLMNPVTRLISNFDDYFTWFVTVTPLVTGMLAVAQVGARYETLLALHLLSVALLLIWFPFGKLMHAFFFVAARATTGMIFERRGTHS
ncbi:MAG: nitrate reductase [Chromatiales bacterium]|jgi:nitrate reductase gamma subunit|nr:nitrate reductase [Chromatiales bacterium]MDX9767750.1 nitrate reductase [Ectothiorhodospiraceae bacterium]